MGETTRQRRVLSGYRGAGAGTRVHVLIRTLTAPFDRIDAAVPAAGEVLEFGCGHGVLTNRLAVTAPQRRVLGVDIDTSKLELARRAAERLGVADRAAFRSVDPEWVPPRGGFDAVVCVDVLYLLGNEAALRAVRSMAAAVRPGGVIVIKEMGDRPRWKRRWTEAQERISTGRLRITQGSTLDFVALEEIADEIRGCGFETATSRVDRHHLHPHEMVSGRAPR